MYNVFDLELIVVYTIIINEVIFRLYIMFFYCLVQLILLCIQVYNN